MASTPLIAFGIMLLLGALGGYLAHRVSWLPSITGFMVVGLVCGPGGLGLLTEETMLNSRLFIDIALALILYRLGLSLDTRMIGENLSILFKSLFETSITLILVVGTLGLFKVPLVLSVLLGAIVISSSPAVLLHVAHEVGARGKVTETAKTLVAINNLISFVVFSLALPALHYSSGFGWLKVFVEPAYQLLGSFLLGYVLARILHELAEKTRRAYQYRLALVIGMIMLSVGLALQFKVSVHFVPLFMGLMIKSMEKKALISNLEFGSAFELFFIVLFVFAGAGLHWQDLFNYAPIVLAVVLVRSFAKIFGVVAVASLRREPLREAVSCGILLIPMAGMAIGLTMASCKMYPQYAGMISAIAFGAVTLFETMGPPLAAYAFRLAGEARVANHPPVEHE